MKNIYHRMVKGLVVVGCLLLAPTVSNAQETGNFELAERFSATNVSQKVGSTSISAQWLKDADKFWYQWNDGDGRRWMYIDIAKKIKRPLFNQDDLAAKLSEQFNKGIPATDLPLRNFRFDEDKKLFRFHVDSIEFTYHADRMELIKGDTLKREPTEPWASYSPDSTWIAFARKHNLYVMRADDPDSTEIQLTTDGERWFSYQANQGDTVSTRRLRANARWFEDSKKMMVKRQDFRKVGDLWVINTLGNNRPSLNTYKYAMPGEKEHYVDHMEIFDPNSKEKVRINAEKWPDQSIGGTYFGSGGGVFITKKSDYVYFLRRNRTWDELDVCKANTATGEVEVLWSETSKPYFNTRYAQLAIINEGQEFLWWSERTGWGQLYRYDAKGNLKNRITSGHYMVGDIARIDTTAQTIYFSGFGREAGQHPYYANYYKIKFDGTGMKHLTPEDANHTFTMSQTNKFFVSNYSRVDLPTKSVLRDSEGRVIMDLESVNMARLDEIGYKLPEVFTVKAADNVTDIYGVMWKPVDFDPNKKYPIITYVYPGPQTEPFPIPFSISGNAGRSNSLAQVGFIVIAIGNRGGNPIRHKAYHQYGYDNLRDYALADNKYGIEQLAARHSFIDISRVGIYGHSGGGFMSSAAILSYPDFYKVAVSSAGNHDNNIYNIWWGEVHHGVKATTRKVKEKDENGVEREVERTTFSSRIPTNAQIAPNLKGRLLLVHGEVDNNVHPANTYRLAEALIRAGKKFEMIIFPGAAHGFTGHYSAYFEYRMFDYFAEHLLGHYRPNVEFVMPRTGGGAGGNDD
jgi:dipeptidyl aminopeptidase/acylaminoacyl peptidase